MDGQYELSMVRLLSFLVLSFLISGCTKCVECEVKLKESQDIIGYVDEFCGTDKKVEAEEERLRSDYTCVECNVTTGFGPTSSGVLCGNREYTDSIQAEWDAGAFILGTTANCIYYRDTANVICVLK